MRKKFLWHAEEVEMPALDFEKIERWLTQVANNNDYNLTRVSYLFTNDAKILATNKQFLNHDYFTDIITFDYTAGNKLAGDIVISLDTVKSNAQTLGEDYNRELLRVIVHGVLHLCGVNDKLPGEREIMESLEDKALALFQSIS